MEIDFSKYETAIPIGKVKNSDDSVVGREIDENNHPWYVIKSGSKMTVLDAENAPVLMDKVELVIKQSYQQIANLDTSVSDQPEQNNPAQ